MIARSWICELLPYGADRCDSAQNVVRDVEALNLSPWGVVVALVFGMSLIGLVMSVPVSVGSAASRWATARYAGPMDAALIGWAAAVFVGLPLVSGALAAMLSIPGGVGPLVVVVAALACGLLHVRRSRRPSETTRAGGTESGSA